MVQGCTVSVNHITTIYTSARLSVAAKADRTSAPSEVGSVWAKAKALVEHHTGKKNRNWVPENNGPSQTNYVVRRVVPVYRIIRFIARAQVLQFVPLFLFKITQV